MGYPYNVPPYAVLSPKDVGLLHQASLDILATVGIRVPNARVLDLASEIGAKVDRLTEVVKFTPEITRRGFPEARHRRRGGGNFLSSEMTAKNCRKEFWFPRLSDRNTWDAWEREGKTSISQRAEDRLRQLLEKVETEPIDPKLARELEQVLAASGIPVAAEGGKK